MLVFPALGGDLIPPFFKIWVIFLKNRQKTEIVFDSQGGKTYRGQSVPFSNNFNRHLLNFEKASLFKKQKLIFYQFQGGKTYPKQKTNPLQTFIRSF